MTSEDWEDLACPSDLQSVEISDSAVINTPKYVTVL
jgi:hypothetical protein